MNVLMYPLGPEDDFPDEFCAIRQGSGEHWFYTPVGEDASWMLFRALADNAKLRELVSNCHGWLAVNCEKSYVIPRNGLDAIEQSMRELGMEVDL